MSLASSVLSPSFAAPSRRAGLTAAVAALIACVLTLASPAVLGDGDTFWHVAVGEWILAHHAVPHADPFTFSMAGAPWSAHEWLSEILFALAYRLGAWSGILVLAGASLAATAYVLARRLAGDIEGAGLIVLITLGLCLQLGSLLARPHILALPLLAAWAAGMFSARDAGRAPSLALLPLMTLWANLHGSFIFGLVLAGFFALEALVESAPKNRMARLRGWALFGLLAVGATLVNPRGVEALVFPFQLMRMKSLAGVAEWRPESFDQVGPLEIELLALLGFAMLRPLKLAPMRLLLLIGLIHLSLHHTRHAMLLGLIGPMLLARPIAEATGQPATCPAPSGHRQIFAVCAIFLLLAGARLAMPFHREDGAMAPISALAAVPADLRMKPVLNHYGFGGYLIFSGVKPFIDGRTDMFGDAFLDNYDRIVGNDRGALDEVLHKQAIEWAIFPPATPVARALAMRPGWKRIYGDEFAQVFAREDFLAPELRR
jgi:hypothetical protein